MIAVIRFYFHERVQNRCVVEGMKPFRMPMGAQQVYDRQRIDVSNRPSALSIHSILRCDRQTNKGIEDVIGTNCTTYTLVKVDFCRS